VRRFRTYTRPCAIKGRLLLLDTQSASSTSGWAHVVRRQETTTAQAHRLLQLETCHVVLYTQLRTKAPLPRARARPAARSYSTHEICNQAKKRRYWLVLKFKGNNMPYAPPRWPLFFPACVGIVPENHISARKKSRREVGGPAQRLQAAVEQLTGGHPDRPQITRCSTRRGRSAGMPGNQRRRPLGKRVGFPPAYGSTVRGRRGLTRCFLLLT
jgi:hypothetical protein